MDECDLFYGRVWSVLWTSVIGITGCSMDAGRVRELPVELLLLAFLALAVNVCARK